VKPTTTVRQEVDVCIGKAGTTVGTVTYVKQGQREHTAFVYDETWLSNPDAFKVSPDLDLIRAYQQRKAPSLHDSVFPFALADTEPDAWGRRVIARDHAKRRKEDRTTNSASLTEMDYLLAVDDFSRIGALRLSDKTGKYLRTVEEGKRTTPPLLELQKMYDASRAVEKGTETTEDLRYLQGKGTSLGGMRPKCTVIDDNGLLALGKFPSISDTRAITRGEVLALILARKAGIDAATARIVELNDIPVAVVQRFDRTEDSGRIPYLSAASLLQASREDEHSYVEIADAIRANGYNPSEDVQALWRRVVFNLLITNVDDHLQNHGFLHVANGQWRLAPAFDINPFPDKDRESKTWLSEEDGPVTELRTLFDRRAHFDLSETQALAALGEIYKALVDWKIVALSPDVGLKSHELEDFAPAFEHRQMDEAKRLLSC
jgi:serine/threonine-protein kinase HipA